MKPRKASARHSRPAPRTSGSAQCPLRWAVATISRTKSANGFCGCHPNSRPAFAGLPTIRLASGAQQSVFLYRGADDTAVREAFLTITEELLVLDGVPT